MGMNISDFFDMDVLIQILTDWSLRRELELSLLMKRANI